MVETLENLSKEDLVKTIGEKQVQIEFLKHQLEQYQKIVHGSKTEKFIPSQNPEQITLDLDLPSDIEAPLEKSQHITYNRKRSKKQITERNGRMEFPKDLPREEIIIEPAEDTTGFVKIGEEVTEELEVTPAVFFVKKYVRPKYAKPNGEGVVIAVLPSRPINKGIPGPGLLATVLTDKYVDHLPIYRQVRRYQRMGVELSESTIGDWISESCTLLTPLYDLLKQQTLSSSYLQADESPIPVLDKSKKEKTHRGYYWVYHAPNDKKIFFDYREGRGREGPTEILKNFKGFLQSDGYGVYEKFDVDGITTLNCMAHARRKFIEALDNDKDRCNYVLERMQELYIVESFAREKSFSHNERYKIRQEKSVPILKELQAWFLINLHQVPPASIMGKAIAYSYNRWDKLCEYTKQGHLEIDNNLIENAIRPVALGRKNYLFAGSHKAAARAAMIYSFFAMCKYHNLNPYHWLKETLAKISDTKMSDLASLLPTGN
jgi:transposase